MERFAENPLVRPEDLGPSREGLEVVGAFNAGAFEFEGRFGLLLRVAERPVAGDPGVVSVPLFRTDPAAPGIDLLRLRCDDPTWDFSDPRVVVPREGNPVPHAYLTNLSHFRIAWSTDGRRFQVDEDVVLWPRGEYERQGIEDPRVTRIDGTWLVTYSAVSERGIGVGLLTTADFRRFESRGLILPPENKDAGFFPERIGGGYVALHRPAGTWCRPGIWVARGPDPAHLGEHRFVAGPRPGRWDARRVGAGPPPVRTSEGWLVFYHGAGDGGYCLGALLLDLKDPAVVLARSDEPLLRPEAEYERVGFFGDVVFCNGLVERPGGELWLYYGAADRVTAGCRCTVGEVLESLG